MIRLKALLSIDTETGEGELIDQLPDDAQFVVVRELTVPLLLADNLIDQCSACGQAVQRRPFVKPDGFPLVCMACVPDWVEGLEASQ